MKYLSLLILVVSSFALAQSGSPSPSPTPPIGVVGTLVAQWSLIALIVKSVLDLLFAINPKVDAPGGVIDAIYQFLKGLVSPKQ